MRALQQATILLILLCLPGVAIAQVQPENTRILACDEDGDGRCSNASASNRGHWKNKYGVGSYDCKRLGDRIDSCLNVIWPSEYPSKFCKGREECYPNLQLFKDGLTESEARDWLCLQVEIKRDIPDPKYPHIKENKYLFHGKLYAKHANYICEDWRGPYTNIRIDKDGRTPSSASENQPPDNSVPSFPSGASGSLQHCLENASGGSPDTPKYETGTRAADWQAQFDADWEDATRGSPPHQARMLREGHVWVEERGWVDGGVIRKETQRCMSGHLQAQVLRLAGSVGGDQGAIIERMAKIIASDPDPASALARLQRLRNGAFSILVGEGMRAEADAEFYNTFQEGVRQDSINALDVITSFTDTRDFYEFISGRDAIHGHELSWFGWGLTGVGLVIGSGKVYRELLNTEKVAGGVKALSKGEKAALEAGISSTTKNLPEAARPHLRHAEHAAFEVTVKRATKKVDDYVVAMKSKDPRRIKKAVMEIQADQMSIVELNKRNPYVINHFNKNLHDIYGQTRKELKEGLAEHVNKQIAASGQPGKFRPNKAHHVPAKEVKAIQPDDVTIYGATNPSSKPKAGLDQDMTARVFGQDIPEDVVQKIHDEKMYEVLKRNGALPDGVTGPEGLGELLDQQAVGWRHTQAYDQQSLGGVLNPRGRKLKDKTFERRKVPMHDPRSIADTIEHKGIEHFNHAGKLRQAGNLEAASKQMWRGMYELHKQYSNQILGRAEFAVKKGKFNLPPASRQALDQAVEKGDDILANKILAEHAVPERLRRTMDLLGKVRSGQLSPMEAEAILKSAGMTPNDVARMVKDQFVNFEVLIMSGAR